VTDSQMNDPEHDPLQSPPPEEDAPEAGPPQIAPPVDSPEVLPAAPPPDRFPPWSGWDVAAVLFVTLAAVFLFSLVGLGVAHVFTAKRHVSIGELATNPIVVIGSQIAAYPAVIWCMIILVRSKSRERFWSAIRWNWPEQAILRFLVSGMVFAFAVELASRWLPIPKSLPVDRYFSDPAGAYLMAAFGVTLAPLLEELFFRGMLYPLLRRWAGVKAAVLLTAAAFASIHGAQLGYAWAPLISIFVVGLVFTLVRERTGSVAASFLTHCGYNLALFTMLWIGTDHFHHLEKALN